MPTAVVGIVLGLTTPVAAADDPEPGEIAVVATDAGLGRLHIDVAPDGTLYIVDRQRDMHHVDEDGQLKRVPASRAPTTDDGKVLDSQPTAVGAASDGSLYVATAGAIVQIPEPENPRVEKLADTGTPENPVPVQVDDIAVGADVVYLADDEDVFQLDRDGKISRLTGSRGATDSGSFDGMPLADVDLEAGDYFDIDTDSAGQLHVSNGAGVWRVEGADHRLSRVVGAGEPGYSGDGGPAADAHMSGAIGAIAFDNEDNLYVDDRANGVVRKIAPSGRIETDMSAVSHGFSTMAIGQDGDIYFANPSGPYLAHTRVVRVTPGVPRLGEVQPAAGRSPVAGAKAGTVRVVADDLPPGSPRQMSVGRGGELYFRLPAHRIWAKVDHDGTVDADLAAQVGEHLMMAAGADGELYAATKSQVFRVRPDGTRTLIAGRRAAETPNTNVVDGEPAIFAALADIEDLKASPDGELVVAAESGIYRITRDGLIETVRDTWSDHDSIAVGPHGEVYATERNRTSVVRIDRAGEPVTVAGSGKDSSDDDNGDGGDATDAPVRVTSLAVDQDGVLYLGGFDEIRRVKGGVIDTVRKHPQEGTTRTAIPSMAVSNDGDLYFSDPNDNTAKVIAKPAEIGAESQFPWTPTLWIGGAVIAVLLAAWIWHRRRPSIAADSTSQIEQ